MKNEKNLMQMVIAGLLSVLVVVLVLGRGERVVIVNEGYSRPPVVSSSVTPQFGDNDPDWWQHTVPFNDGKPEEEIYYIKEVTNVLDGDTIDVYLDWEKQKEGETVRIRLAGINCPERFDQNCWIQARDFTEDFIFDYNIDTENNINLRTTKMGLEVKIIGNNSEMNRLVGIVVNSQGDDLGGCLIEQGLALPCFGYLQNYKLFSKMSEYDSILTENIKQIRNNKHSVWSTINSKITLDLSPYLSKENDDKSKIYLGDRIVVKYNCKNFEDSISLSGYSIFDESSAANSRFFLPRVLLKCKNNKSTPFLTVYTGSPPENRGEWKPSENANYQPDTYMIRTNNVINDDGDTIFLRNADRRVIAWAYWTGEECKQAGGMEEYINGLIQAEKDKNTKSPGQ